jgi:hypothetical protein
VTADDWELIVALNTLAVAMPSIMFHAAVSLTPLPRACTTLLPNRLSNGPAAAGAAAGDASACIVVGRLEISPCSPVCVLAALTGVDAAAWPASPAALVVGAGEVNGDSFEAAVEEPAYPYIAAASWAHICAYWASVAAIAPVFWPRMFVATSPASNERFAAITGGGTVIAKAVSKAAAEAIACVAAC